jgi:hypothetical protein
MMCDHTAKNKTRFFLEGWGNRLMGFVNDQVRKLEEIKQLI